MNTKLDIRVWSGDGWICEVWNRSLIEDTEVLLSSDDRLIEEMRRWTSEHGGEQVSWNHFWFPSEQDATMFVLRWSSV